jgi:hypothetical protein
LPTMPDPTQSEKVPVPIHIRPPTFERRFIAAQTDDPDTLVALASDESYFVRRQAVQNPNTPQWVLDLLVRAGATPDLRGKGEVDPDLDPDALRRLAEAGPWARQLVVEHPNTSTEVLAALKDQPSVPLRLAIAAHPNSDQATLATLCCDIEDEIRAQAVANPNCPSELIELLIAAGAAPDLQGVTRSFGDVTAQQLVQLADLGAWGRFLAARHPNCPPDLLTAISSDPEWRVRSGLLDNPNTPAALVQILVDAPDSGDIETIQFLSQPQISGQELAQLAHDPNPEVRMALARHPDATPDVLGLLATDGVKEIRALAASHPRIKAADLELLVRAGSTPDLMGLSEPDATMSGAEIQALLDGGVWARQLAVRHPNTDADTLAHLLCDGEPKIREWAAVHPNLPPETKRDLVRAGSGTDLQGIAPPDPDLPPEVLYRISRLGSWGAWVVANNPYAPEELLDKLADSDDWQVRVFVARNPSAPVMTVERLEKDLVEKVSQAARDRVQNGRTS